MINPNKELAIVVLFWNNSDKTIKCLESLYKQKKQKFSLILVDNNSDKHYVQKIFKWLKTKNISDQEMMKTFNCGIGFCLIVSKKNIEKIKKVFSKKFKPYEIGFISKSKKIINLSNSIRW